MPRVAVVKQDVNEDLYCVPAGCSAREIVESTLLRTGPAALFLDWAADFFVIETVPDAECAIWQERATALHWDTLEFYESYRHRIPGRQYGQSKYAHDPAAVDWSDYDIVISVDNAVPARVTRRFPNTLWAYYVREIKSPAYQAGLTQPLPGQDIVLNHEFHPEPRAAAPHVIDFPYHLQRLGCLQEIFEVPFLSHFDRAGIFVDHHTMVSLSPNELVQLSKFGPVTSTIHDGNRPTIPTSEKLARRTLDDDLRTALFSSRYFLCTPQSRRVFGTAIVEAVAAGCLTIASPQDIGCPFLVSAPTSAATPRAAAEQISQLEDSPEATREEIIRQQQLVDWLCYYRPLTSLLDCWIKKKERAL